MEALRARWRRVDRRPVDAAVALVLFALMATDLATKPLQPGQKPTTWWAYLLAAGLCLPFAVHRRRPVTALVVQCVVLLAYAPGAWVAFPGLPVFALVAGVALHSDRRRALLAAAASAGALVVAVQLQPEAVREGTTMVATLLAVAVAWLWGRNLRGRRDRFAALEERARRAEVEREERARLAVAEERLRIARELHDVVAHALSVVAVQSGVAHHVIDTRPEAAGRALAVIESTSREALVEMRRMLGVLRGAGDAGAAGSDERLGPAPGLVEVPGLVEQVRDAGLPVDLDLPAGLPRLAAGLAPGVQLVAYRVVQEGLTNVLRHGGPAAHVTMAVADGELSVEVTDAGRGGPPGAADLAGGGHGLVGLRERVTIYGGRFSAAPVPGGGFRVRAFLPLSAQSVAVP
jgi:signal transduction histidine kinase